MSKTNVLHEGKEKTNVKPISNVPRPNQPPPSGRPKPEPSSVRHMKESEDNTKFNKKVPKGTTMRVYDSRYSFGLEVVDHKENNRILIKHRYSSDYLDEFISTLKQVELELTRLYKERPKLRS